MTVSFTGLLNYNDYRLLLWRSNLHCYFTRPYVTSWSLFEAAACGARLAVNRSPATAEITEEETVTWVDIDDAKGLAISLETALNDSGTPRSKIRKGFELTRSLQSWEELLNKALQSKRSLAHR